MRLGIVPYLNVHPLILTLRNRPDVELIPAPPSKLARELAAGAYDAAIVPVFEYLRNASQYRIVPGVSIASYGPVRSVVLFSSRPLAEVSRVHLDPASLSSVHLLKVLLAEMGYAVDYVSGEWSAGVGLPEGEAGLLIGDPALAEHGRHPFSYDLATVWREHTGLPFVFAAWIAPVAGTSAGGVAELDELLLNAKVEGVARLDEVAEHSARGESMGREEILTYFRDAICYDLGEKELAGMREYARLCVKYEYILEVPGQ